MLSYNNCPHCFMPLRSGTVCEYCGRDYRNDPCPPGILTPFTVLKNRYLVGRMLGKGGFGVTYVAMDLHRNMRCAIKEYMPSEYSTRMSGSKDVIPFSDTKAKTVYYRGRDKYIEEARTLEKLKNNPHVVTILDYFNENNTAYLVMELIDGEDLRKQAVKNGGRLEPKLAIKVFVTVAKALSEIHRMNILHRDISPENIIISKKGTVKILDFGSARNYVSSQKKGLSILLKQGFAPPEQYNTNGNQGPWTDVYSLCATFYNLVSGRALIDALYRIRGERQPSLISLGCPVTKKISDVIERGMSLDYRVRYKNFEELLKDIDLDMNNYYQSNNGYDYNQGNYNNYASNEPANIPYIVELSNNVAHRKMYLRPNEVINIGRSNKACQYVVSQANNISRLHCSLRFDGQRVFITDLSTNGTFFANGKRLTHRKEYVLIPNTKFYLVSAKNTFILKV